MAQSARHLPAPELTKPSTARKYIDRILARPAQDAGGLDKIPDGHGFGVDQTHLIETLAHYVATIDPSLTEEWLTEDEGVQFRELFAILNESVYRWRIETQLERDATGGKSLKLRRLVELAALLDKFKTDDAKPALYVGRFHCVSGDALRRVLADDLISMERLMRLAEWKAATVLGGSIVEALLLDQLVARERADGGVSAYARDKGWDLRTSTWDLERLIQGSASLNIIDAEDQKSCSLSQQYRNLIHPGKVERVKTMPGPHTAEQAHATVLRLLEKWK